MFKFVAFNHIFHKCCIFQAFFALLRYGGKIWTWEESSDEQSEADSEGEKHPDPKCQLRFLGGFREDGEANSEIQVKKLHYTLNTKLGLLKQDGKQQNVTSWRKMVDTFSRKSRFVASIFIFPELEISSIT